MGLSTDEGPTIAALIRAASPRRLAIVAIALILFASGPARAQEHDRFSVSANASSAPDLAPYNRGPMYSLGGAASYAPHPLYAFGVGFDAFLLSTRECGQFNACSTLPSGGQLFTAHAAWRPALVGPLGVFIQGSAGVARVTIGTYDPSNRHEAWGTARLALGPELRGIHLLFRAFGSLVVLGSKTSPGFGLELGASF